MDILVRMRFAKHSKVKCSVVVFENLEIKERDGVVLLWLAGELNVAVNDVITIIPKD